MNHSCAMSWCVSKFHFFASACIILTKSLVNLLFITTHDIHSFSFLPLQRYDLHIFKAKTFAAFCETWINHSHYPHSLEAEFSSYKENSHGKICMKVVKKGWNHASIRDLVNLLMLGRILRAGVLIAELLYSWYIINASKSRSLMFHENLFEIKF